MKAARAGRPERDVYERWVREHHAAVWRAARRILRDEALASDVAQRVYLRALEHGLALAPGESPERLLCWMACKESLTELRGRRRRAAHEERAAMEDDDAGRAPFEQSNAAEARAWLARELDALAEDLRTVLVLRYQQGLTLREIGALLELAESSVHERVERGLVRLRKRAERAGLAGVLVDWSGELSACEPALAPPSSLAPSLLETGSAATAWSASTLLVPACVLLAACVAVAAWWKLAPHEPRAHATALASTSSALSVGDEPIAAAELPHELAARAEVAVPAPGDVEAASPAAPTASSAAVAQTVVSGRIVDADRVPLAGISLAVRMIRSKSANSFSRRDDIATDAAGRFSESLVSGAAYELDAEHHARLPAPVLIRTEDAREIDLGDIEVGARAAEIYGDWKLTVSIVDERGQPLDRVDVLALPHDVAPRDAAHWWRASTDASGRAEIRGDRCGTIGVHADAPSRELQPASVALQLEHGATELALTLVASRTLYGRLVPPAGESFESASLGARQPGVRRYVTAEFSGDAGEFRLVGLSDKPLMLTWSGSDRFSDFELHLPGLPTGPLVLELKRADDPRDVALHRGELHGRCVDTTGRPVAIDPWEVRAVAMSAESSGDFWADVAGALRPFQGQVAFGPEGRPEPSAEFHQTGLAPGRYALVASADGYALGIAGPFVIDAVGENSATIVDGIDIVLERPWTLVAELERGPATPAEGEGLWLASGSGEPTPLAGNVVGDTIEWTGLHPRIPYRVVLQGVNGARLESALIRTSGSGREVVRFESWPGRD